MFSLSRSSVFALPLMLAAFPSFAAVARGRVSCGPNAPGNNVAVAVVVNGRRVATIITGSDGSFYLSGLPTGAAMLQVWSSAQAQSPATWPLSLGEQAPTIVNPHLPACPK